MCFGVWMLIMLCYSRVINLCNGMVEKENEKY